MEQLNKIPDSAVMSRDYFRLLLRANPRAVRFGFSKKHTGEIMAIRGTSASQQLPSNLYHLPVEWNVKESFILNRI